MRDELQKYHKSVKEGISESIVSIRDLIFIVNNLRDEANALRDAKHESEADSIFRKAEELSSKIDVLIEGISKIQNGYYELIDVINKSN